MKENFEKLQKLFQIKNESIGGEAEKMKNVQQFTAGYGTGGFVAIGAEK